jgi:succinate dehydrogenase/fumarate reductase cytochrome b subunit
VDCGEALTASGPGAASPASSGILTTLFNAVGSPNNDNKSVTDVSQSDSGEASTAAFRSPLAGCLVVAAIGASVIAFLFNPFVGVAVAIFFAIIGALIFGAVRHPRAFFGALSAVAGIVWFWSAYGPPKNVGYDDLLTKTNATTFASHHAWENSGPEEGNTVYAQRAIQHLGAKAYGRKFGDLMDWEKEYESEQFARLHPTPKPDPLEVALGSVPSDDDCPDISDLQGRGVRLITFDAQDRYEPTIDVARGYVRCALDGSGKERVDDAYSAALLFAAAGDLLRAKQRQVEARSTYEDSVKLLAAILTSANAKAAMQSDVRDTLRLVRRDYEKAR